MKLPKKSQWRQFFKVLNKTEKTYFFILLGLFFLSFAVLLINFYLNNTKVVPADGGIYIEGLLGSPRYINPIYAPLSDADRDLTELIFSGLMKYNSDGKLQLDLAKDYKVLEDGKIYEFYLKENLFWQDSQPLTVDDVIFTIDLIQNPDIKSPLRPAWLGVEVEKVSEGVLRFKLKNESSVFLENTTLKIIPKHIWEDTPQQNFPLTSINLNPIGSGPYKLEKLSRDKDGKIISLDLIPNPVYFGEKPHLLKIFFRFFNNEEEAIKALDSGEIKGFSLNSVKNFPKNKNSNLYSFSLPRYFVIFFNQKNSKVLSEKEVRLALNYGTDKDEILSKVLSNYGTVVNSPILPDIYGFKAPSKIYSFDKEKSKEILEKAGFLLSDSGIREKFVKRELTFQFKNNLSLGSTGKDVEELQKCLAKDSQVYPEGEITSYFGEKTKGAVIRFQEKYSQDILKPDGLEKGTGEVKKRTRDKLNEICFEKPEEKIPLKISLTTVNDPSLIEAASILKNQWLELGVEIEIKIVDSNTLEREILGKREFEALLFGEILGLVPDPFPFWHSSQKGEFGLNLANYENKKCDKLLEAARQSLDENESRGKLEEFQDLLIEDSPVVFLYNPDYLYFVSKEIKGLSEKTIVDPSKRFTNIENWYVYTKRAWK